MGNVKGRPLPSEIREWFLNYIRNHNLTVADMARQIGLKRSTLRDNLDLRHLSSEPTIAYLQLIMDNGGPLPETPQPEEQKSFLSSDVRGDEKPAIKSDELTALLAIFKIRAHDLVEILKKLVNGDRGSRLVLHDLCTQELADLYVLVRALQSESMRDKVLAELGRTTLP